MALMTDAAAATTPEPVTPTQRLLAELRRDRDRLRVDLLLTALTGIGLLVGVAAVYLGSRASGSVDLPGFLERYFEVGPAHALAAAAGLVTAYLAGGIPIGMTALRTLVRRRRLNIDLLMLLAALAAALVGEARDGAVLLFLFSLAETLERFAMGNTKRAVASLMRLKPETATLLESGGHRSVPASQVALGATIVVKPGERVPLDGVVLTGASAVDQAPITGESIPVDKTVGDTVFAGTVNGYGALEVRVSKDATHSTLARMIDLVTAAQAQRSPSQRFSDWFGQRYTALVLVGSAAALGAFLLVGMGAEDALYRAATLLVVASPCAVAISVPAAVLSALARSARMGVLFKGGGALEDLASTEILALDKTGTLTEGRMKVTEVVGFAAAEAEVLALASLIESSSEHPVAKAIVAAAAVGNTELISLNVRFTRPSSVTAVPGKGVRAVIEGRAYWAGNRKLAIELGVTVPSAVEKVVAELEQAGQTVVMIGAETADGPGVIGAVAVADAIRASAPGALASLRRAGIRTVAMLTGDNATVAHAVAARLGITPDNVHAELLPEQKVVLVNSLGKQGKVAYLGDGVNDAAALATASLGIAMGAAGSDSALEAADVALLADDLGSLPGAFELARRTSGVIRQNLIFALSVMAALVMLTLLGRVPMPLAVLGHEGGTILVVLNGLRLLAFRPPAR